MSIKEMVSNGKRVQFVRYHQNELWYKTECGFEFPVPISETGDASFGTDDKAILFMRWMKKHIDTINASNNEKKVQFVRYQQNELWYKTECGFEFPIPISDTRDASFGADNKEILFKHWITKHVDTINAAKAEQMV